MKQKILIVDDHAVVRQGLAGLLTQAGFTVVGEAEDGESAYQQAQKLMPDLIVLDLDMPGIGGLETIHKLLSRDAEVNILIFSMHDDAIYASRALQAGAKGYIVKTDAPELLLEAVRTILKGGRYIGEQLAQKMAIEQLSLVENPLSVLSPREFEVFRRLALGESLSQISEQLHIGYKTTANVQTQIRQKLGVETTGQLVHLAMKLGILQHAKPH